ncbi:MAG TPA: ornithine carbamoyltransferase [Candidatus Acidoferrales bacterium]|nr:ornithine carbamoyltransferase [Candidatus Acidoferrales bacterium]
MISTAPVNRLLGRNLLRITDLNQAELLMLLNLATQIKAMPHREQHSLLPGRTLVMLFEKPSLRTRISFEVGMSQLGGTSIFAQGSEFGVGKRETPEDAARSLSRYANAIVIRMYDHPMLERLANASTVPVINALSQFAHPCQALADVLTIRERFGTLEGLRLAYIGDGRNNVAQSLAEAAAMAGVSITFGCPPTHRPSDAFLAKLAELGKSYNVTARAFTSPIRAVKEVDVVYTDVWTSMGDEQYAERNAAALLGYQVDSKLMKAAASHAIFMHCLPAHRGEEVTDDVMDGIQSVVFDQAENRMHAQKALLLALLTDLKGFEL